LDSLEPIRGLMIQLTIGRYPALFLALAEDGTVTRWGSGTVNEAEQEVYMGSTTEPLFQRLKGSIEPWWLNAPGPHIIGLGRGEPCELSIVFLGPASGPWTLQFHYGSDSAGPPPDITSFVNSAIALTEPWYTEQRETADHQPR
jgi:hypothetical protein